MVELWICDDFAVDAASVLLELWCGLNATADRAVFEDVLLHGFSSADASVLRDVVQRAWYVEAVVLELLAFVWNRWVTGLAGLQSVAFELNWVLGLVLLTGVVVEAVGVSKFVDSGWVSAIAATASVTVDDNLRRDARPWEDVFP